MSLVSSLQLKLQIDMAHHSALLDFGNAAAAVWCCEILCKGFLTCECKRGSLEQVWDTRRKQKGMRFGGCDSGLLQIVRMIGFWIDAPTFTLCIMTQYLAAT
jgi:hypothetical protein